MSSTVNTNNTTATTTTTTGHQRKSSTSNNRGGGGGSPLISSQIPSSLLPNLIPPVSSIPPLYLNPSSDQSTTSTSTPSSLPPLSQSSPSIITPSSISTSTTPNLTLSSHALPTLSSNTNNVASSSTTGTTTETLVVKTKGANTEVYGFVYWIATIIGYVIYLLWAFIPEHVLSDLGVHYYPSKYWAIAIPMYIIVCIIFGMTVYFSINLIITKPFDSFNTCKDEYTQTEPDTSHVYLPESIPPLEDIPLDIINKILYQTKSNNSHNIGGRSSNSLLTNNNNEMLPHYPLSQPKTTTLSNLSLSPLNTQSISINQPSSSASYSSPTTNSTISPPLTGIRHRGALSSSTSSTRELVQQLQQSPTTSSPRSHYLPLLSHFNSPNLSSLNHTLSPINQSSSSSSSNSGSDQDSSSNNSSTNSSPSSSTTTMRRVNTLPTINSSTE